MKYQARTTMTYREQAVTATAAKVSIVTGMNGKEYMMISNIGAASCWIGDSTVTSTSGYPIRPNAAYDFGQCTPLFNFYVAGAGTATTTLGVFES
jgi:hypothetical protein